MRIHSNPRSTASLPAAAKPARSPHAAGAKPAAVAKRTEVAAAAPAKVPTATEPPATYAGAGSLLDAHA